LKISPNAITPPRLRPENLDIETFGAFELTREIDLSGLQLSGIAFGNAQNGRFSQVQLKNARLGAVSWRRAHFEDAIFDGSDFAGADNSEIFLSRVQFLDCRALGLQAAESNWRDVTMQGGNWSLAQFRYAKFERVRFENLNLREADFQNADLRGAIFQDCDLRGAQFSFARLQNADFRTSQTEDMSIDAGALRGLIVSPLQAAQFASVLGLQVRWNDEGRI
jgi:uncharacterized protein YjbI with pentapeptide repeats